MLEFNGKLRFRRKQTICIYGHVFLLIRALMCIQRGVVVPRVTRPNHFKIWKTEYYTCIQVEIEYLSLEIL